MYPFPSINQFRIVVKTVREQACYMGKNDAGEAVEQINDFVAMAVTESRLEQGLHNLINEQMKPFAMTSMGDFIRWVHQDVLKEEADTLQASGIEYKKLGSPIALAAKRWFVQKLNEATFK